MRKSRLRQDEHLAGNQVEPSCGHGDHGVPDESDGGKGKLHLHELLPWTPAIHFGDLVHFARNGLQRGIEAEGHVPGLSGKNQQDRTKLDPELPPREKGNHGQHDAGEKAQYRDGLQGIEQRNHDAFGLAVVSRDISVGDAENQADEIGDGDTNDRKHGVSGQRCRPQIDFGLGGNRSEPIARHREKRIEDGKGGEKNRQVLEERRGVVGKKPPGEGISRRRLLRLVERFHGRLHLSARTSSPWSFVSECSRRLSLSGS